MFGTSIRLAPRFLAAAGVAALAATLSAQTAFAVPSFARQTGFACEACHTVFPQLTPFGRLFKASGYTLFNTAKVQDINQMKKSTLSLSDLPPISAMIMGSTSVENKANDSGSSKTSTDFPQQASLFYAGRISDNVGAFFQLTYDDQAGTIGIDNTDIRYADVTHFDGHSVTYGVSLNNNPTVQDLWNSTPAWSQPFIGSPAIQGPPITQIEGAMAQIVAGLSAYAYVDQAFYGEAGVYRSALQGQSVANNGNTTNNIIAGVAPYWRFAYEDDWGNNSLEFGTLGLAASLQNPTTPAGNAINGSLQGAAVDRFLDAGLDSQYEYTDDDDQISVDARWIHEEETLDASYDAGFASSPKDHLDSFNLNGSYYWHRKYGLTLGLFDVEGSKDPVYFGNATGSPQTTWSMAEVDYLPWQNVKIGLQYNAFFTFDGRSSNYDGLGRNAPDNNLLYGFLWLAF